MKNKTKTKQNTKLKLHWSLGFLGFLGFLGLINPIYYVFFVFLLFFLQPIVKSKKK